MEPGEIVDDQSTSIGDVQKSRSAQRLVPTKQEHRIATEPRRHNARRLGTRSRQHQDESHHNKERTRTKGTEYTDRGTRGIDEVNRRGLLSRLAEHSRGSPRVMARRASTKLTQNSSSKQTNTKGSSKTIEFPPEKTTSGPQKDHNNLNNNNENYYGDQ